MAALSQKDWRLLAVGELGGAIASGSTHRADTLRPEIMPALHTRQGDSLQVAAAERMKGTHKCETGGHATHATYAPKDQLHFAAESHVVGTEFRDS